MNITADPAVRVYIARTGPLEDPELFESAYRTVSPVRRSRIDSVRFEADKRLSLGAELLLMRACRDFGVEYEKEAVIYDGLSKPRFSASPLSFNLSHSGDRVMCAMSRLQVGCDTERIRDIGMNIAERFFSPEEYAALSRQVDPEARRDMFFRLWTLKESYVKCTGRGIRTSFRGFTVSLDTDGPVLDTGGAVNRFSLFEALPEDGYRYALCVENPEDGVPVTADSVRWQRVDIHETE